MDELPVIGVVGTRKATPYGIKMATRIGQEITAGGGCVITGMALGIDGAAARGALLENGPCIGVLGTAIDVNYPAANASLIDDAAAVGAVISEFPPGYPTRGANFPQRNRIISGLSCGVCVVEAPVRSGALITADLALEQGRDLFAVPGNADSPASAGCNALIRDCARAVSSGMDILSEYEGLYPWAIKTNAEVFTPPAKESKAPAAAKTDIDKPPEIPYIDVESRLAEYTEDQQAMLRCLVGGEAHIDEIISATGFSPAKVLSGMTLLVIRGAVRSHPGKRFSLNLQRL
jgi:DNA processing protein